MDGCQVARACLDPEPFAPCEIQEAVENVDKTLLEVSLSTLKSALGPGVVILHLDREPEALNTGTGTTTRKAGLAVGLKQLGRS